jgi:aminoglycoside phosphotransferase family enzyme
MHYVFPGLVFTLIFLSARLAYKVKHGIDTGYLDH